MSAARLASLIRERQPCVVLTGAGISTESGIPDFRSPAGIWAEVDPFEVASIDAFRRDPERVWDFYRKRIHTLLAAEPNSVHVTLAASHVAPDAGAHRLGLVKSSAPDTTTPGPLAETTIG